MSGDPRIVAAATSRAYGRPIPSRLKAVVLRAGTAPTVRWTMVDRRGCPVDLTPFAVEAAPGPDPPPPPVVPVFLRVVENTILGLDPDFIGRCVDAPAGLVEASLDLARMGGPGVYIAEFAVMAADLETVAFSNQLTVLVERGLFAGDPTGIPTLAEIRMLVRDSPQDNELIGDFAWDDAEILQALQAPVDYWNADLPDVGVYYTTRTWPARYRHWWVRGTIAVLYRIASESQRRNQFDYAAGGIQVQDSNRSQEYAQLADAEWQEFKAWVRSTKVALNNELGWGTFGGYGHGNAWP
jgi:hypothetical protein